MKWPMLFCTEHPQLCSHPESPGFIQTELHRTSKSITEKEALGTCSDRPILTFSHYTVVSKRHVCYLYSPLYFLPSSSRS